MGSVDERIVEMRFDNQQFESGVQKSLKTLDQLKSGLQLEDSARSLENLQTTANSVDFGNISNNVGIIANRFSMLGNLVDQARTRISNWLIDLTRDSINLTKSLSIGQIGTGFDKYERKTKAVQTIMNATGLSIEEVNTSLDKLGWYTDETSYSFTDMVSNIGKFTSMNIPLDKAVTSMIGIANAAGLAGASVTDASHAMDGFSKAMGRGFMDSRSWSWIQTAHMDTAQFKQTLIDAAVEAGTLSKVVNKNGESVEYFVTKNKKAAVSVADFQNELHQGWLTADVMTSALHQFGGATEEIYKIWEEHGGEILTSDLIKQYGDQLDALGIKSFKASQEARTFTDAIESVKEAVSTGWATSIEYIFGNKDEAVELWSDVAEELYNIFAEPGNKRNSILKEWYEGGGRDSLINSLKNSWEAVKSISGAIKETFSGLFPTITSEKLLSFTEKVSQFAEKFKKNFVVSDEYKKSFDNYRKTYETLVEAGEVFSEETQRQYNAYMNLQKIKDIFGGLKSVIDLVKFSFKSLGKVVSPLFKIFKVESGSVLDFAAGLGRFITKSVDAITNSKLLGSAIDGIGTFLDGVTSILVSFGDAASTIFKKIVNSEFFKNFNSKIKEVTSSFDELLGNVFSNAVSKISNFLYNLAEKFDADELYNKFQKVYTVIKDFLKPIEKWPQNIRSWVTSSFNSFIGSLSKLGIKIQPTIDSIKNFWNELKASDSPLALVTAKVQKFGDVFANIKKTISAAFGNTKFSDFWNSIKKDFSDGKIRVEKILNDIGEALKNVDWGKVAGIALALSGVLMVLKIAEAFGSLSKTLKGVTTFFTEITGQVKALGGLPAKIGKTFDSLTKAIEDRFKPKIVNLAQAAILFSGAVLILAGAVKMLSNIPREDLINSVAAIAALALVLFSLTAILGKMEGKGKLGNYKNVSIGLFAITASILALTAAIWVLKDIHGDDIGKGLGVILGLIVLLGSLAIVMQHAKVDLKGNGLAMVAMAASVFILVEAIKRLSEIENLDVGSAVAAIGILIGFVSAFALIRKMSKGTFGVGAGVLSMVLSVIAILSFLKILGQDNINSIVEKVKNNIGLIIGVFVALAGLVALTRIGGKNSLRAGMGVLAMATSLLIIYKAIQLFGKMDATTLTFGLIAVALIVRIFRGFSKSIGTLEKGQKSAKVGGAILAMSASLLIIYYAVKKLGALDIPTLAKGITSIFFLLMSLGLALRISSKAIKAGPIVAMTAALIVLIAGLSFLSLYSIEDLAKSVVALSVLMVAFGRAIGLMGKATFNKSSIRAFAISLTAFIAAAGSMYALKDIPWYQLITIAGAIGTCLMAISGAIRLAGNVKVSSTFGNFFAGVLALAAIGFGLYEANKYMGGSWSTVSQIAKTICNALLALSIAMRITSGIPITASIEALGGVIAWIFGLALTFGAITWLAEIAGLNEGNVVQAERIGALIGGFIGGIVGGFGSGMDLAKVEGLPEVATNLSDFAKNITGFTEMIESLPKGFTEKLDSFGDFVKKLGDAELKNAWANLINTFSGMLGGSSANLASDLSSMGTALKEFNTALDGVDSTALATNTGSLILLLNSMKDIPVDYADNPLGNFMSWLHDTFKGNEDYGVLSRGMAEMGNAMKAFSESTTDITPEDLTPAIDSFNKLMGAFKEIPTTGGAVSFFRGDYKWSTISEGLTQFGVSLVSFSFIAKRLPKGTDKIIDSAIAPARKLNELLTEIPEVGGFIQKFTGENSWATLSTGLVDMALALVKFSFVAQALPANAQENVERACLAGKALSDTLKDIPPSEGLKQWFSGEVKWGTISSGLVEFGEAIVGFNNSLKGTDDLNGVDIDFIGPAIESVSKLVDTLVKMKTNTLYGASISNFGDGLSGFGGAVKGMSDFMVQVDTDAIDTVLASLDKLASSTTDYSQLGDDLAKAITQQFSLGIGSYNDDETPGSIAESFLSKIKKDFDTLSVASEDELTKMAAFSQSIAGVITSGLTEAMNSDELSSSFQGIANTIMTGIDNGIIEAHNKKEGPQQLGTSILTGICAGFKTAEASTALNDAGSQFITDINTAISTFSGDVVNTGINIASGLINGMMSMYSSVYAIGFTLGSYAVAGVKAGSVVASPSKAAYKVGAFVGEGLGLGMLSMASYVEDSAEKMASNSILSVASVFDNIDALLAGEVNWNPVITPVLDLSEVSYGASQINGILNSSSSMQLAGQLYATQAQQDLSDLLVVGRAILKEIQNGRDVYLDDGILAGRINRRLGSI